jgi:cytosol alanyl aminopeptidase
MKSSVRLAAATVLCAGLFSAMSYSAARAADTQPQPPQFRLPATAVPSHYNVRLTIVPNEDRFSGSADIDIKFSEPTSVLWLNAQALTIEKATLTVGEQSLTAKVINEPKDLVGFSFEHSVGPGAATLHLSYQGVNSRKDMQGIFQVKDGNSWYVYSQFENIAARQAFPCFDEPSYKVPWQLTLVVPAGDKAFSNTPVLFETPDAKGMKVVKFAETKPLPSYLVAIAVGPMDVVEARHAGANKTAIRIIVPHGRAADAQYVADITPDIVNLLEKYFAIPYPYEKLDQVAIPLAGYAMEHPGLVTYGSGFFLMKPQEVTLDTKRTGTSVIAHELAHQWFGDLVTTRWWDDIWLNEGFASWMANKIVNEYKPEWNMNIDELNNYQRAMGTDELVSSRKVRQPILSDDDIANAFDDITYDKGSALLNMFESYMGKEKFQEGIRAYLKKYAWGNATSAEFLASLGGSDPNIARAFSTFLDQAGVPLVTARLHCEAGNADLQLSQQRFLPHGSQGSPDQTDQVWDIPICIRYPGLAEQARQCSLMSKKTESIRLISGKSCPAWAYANDRQAGYYRVLYTGGTLEPIFKDSKALTVPERVGLFGDLTTLTEGHLPMGEALSLLRNFARDSSPRVVLKTLPFIYDVDNHLVSDSLKPNFGRYVSSLYKDRAVQSGWKSSPGEDDGTRSLRPELIWVLANHAEDPDFIEHSRKLTFAWLDDHSAVEPDLLDNILDTAARHGDRALFDRLRSQAKKETDEPLQRTLLGALGAFRDPAIEKTALDIIVTDDFDPRLSLEILFHAPAIESRKLTYDFVKRNWDALIARLPTDAGASLPYVAADFCDSEHRADVQTFFDGRSTKYTGGPRILAEVLERISLCLARKPANEASVAEFLSKN